MRRERYSKVTRRMWTDAQFQALSSPQPNAQTLWKWLLTCPEQSNVPGLIRIGVAGISEALGWDVNATRAKLGELLEIGWVELDERARLLWITKRIEHDPPANPNVVKSWGDNWSELPECALRDRAHRALWAWHDQHGEAWRKAFEKACGKPPRQAPEQPPGATPISGDAPAVNDEKPSDSEPRKPFGNPSGTPSRKQEQEQDQDQDQPPPAGAREEPPPADPPNDADPGVDPKTWLIAGELDKSRAVRDSVDGDTQHLAESLLSLVPSHATDEDLRHAIRQGIAELPRDPTEETARRKLRRFVERAGPSPAERHRRRRAPQGTGTGYKLGTHALEVIS